MKTSSSIKRNYFRRPAVRQLVPDLKLLLAVLQVGCESHVGCWVHSGLADDAGLSTEACEGGLRDLARSGFIESDESTGEIFLTDFFRNNTFKGMLRKQQALTDFRQVESEALRKSILNAVAQSPECDLSVDFLTSFYKNQQLKNQVKDQVEVKEKSTPLPPQKGVEGLDVDELIQAEIWKGRQRGKSIGPKLIAFIVDRVSKNGPNDRDMETLQAYRRHRQHEQEMFKLPVLPPHQQGQKFEAERAQMKAVLSKPA